MNNILDDYDYYKSNDEYILVNVLKSKGFNDENLLYQVKCIEHLIDNLIKQKHIYNGDD